LPAIIIAIVSLSMPLLMPFRHFRHYCRHAAMRALYAATPRIFALTLLMLPLMLHAHSAIAMPFDCLFHY
jgi:hypothetical protein